MGKLNLLGQKRGKLTIVKETELRAPNGSVMWECNCDCGKKGILVSSKSIANGKKSCGCKRYESKNAKHGLFGTKIYSIWNAMMGRCYRIKHKSYPTYGGRGITVCPEWHDPKIFYDWAIQGYKEGLTIDRINNDDNYSPDNCRWVSHKVQMSNYSRNHLITYKGETQTISQWADEYGIKRTTLIMRICKYHWSLEKALNTPVK